MKYADIRDNIETGDIILFSGTGIVSRAIKAVTLSPWSHVGVALVMPEYDWKLIIESTTLSNIPDLMSGKPVKGVQVVPLSQRIKTYDGDLGLIFEENQPDTHSLFCSEMSAMMLWDMGILRWSSKSANEHTPADFAEDLPLHDGFFWGGLIEVEP
jgi:hypothetical protein